MIPALRRRVSHYLHALGNAIGRPERWLPAPSPADETEAWRKEIEAEVQAEFGLRNIEFIPLMTSQMIELLPAPGPGKAWVWRGGPQFDATSYELVDAVDTVLPMKERK